LSLVPFVLTKVFSVGKKILGKAWDFIKSPKELISGIFGKGKSVVSKVFKVGGKILPKIGEIGSKLGGKLASRAGALTIPGLGGIAALGMSVYDAYKGWNEAGKAFGLEEGEKATLGMKMASAAGRVLTLGLSEKKAAQFIYKFVNKIVSFPLEVLNKFKDYASEKLQSFKDAVKGAFSWIVDLPKKLIEAIKDFLKNSFLGKIFGTLFKDESVPTPEVHHAASGGLFLKESLTHIAEQNKPEVVLPLENPKTHNIIQQYFETYGKKYQYTGDNREEFVKSALETVNEVTNQAIQQREPKIIPIPQPVPQPIVTQQSLSNIDSDGREKTPELQFDFVIEKHLNDIFKNTMITLEKSMQDYIYGNLAFNVA